LLFNNQSPFANESMKVKVDCKYHINKHFCTAYRKIFVYFEDIAYTKTIHCAAILSNGFPHWLSFQVVSKYSITSHIFKVHWCPRFSQDRLNFHKPPGGYTARPADSNWPDKPGIQCHVTSCLVQGGGAGQGEVNLCSGACGALDGNSFSVLSVVYFVYSSYQYYCCYCSLPLLFC